MSLLPPVIAELKMVINDLQAKGVQAQAEIAKMETGSSASFNKMATVGKAAFLGIAAGAVAMGAVAIEQADRFEASHARLETAIRNTGQSMTAWQGQIRSTDQSMEKLGFTNADTENALSRLIPVVKTTEKAHKDLALAADIARARHMDLEAATQLVIKVETGHVALLGRLGIQTKDATGHLLSQQAALDMLTKMYGGQASAYTHTFAGEMQVLKATSEDLAAKLGLVLIPVIQRVGTAISDTIQWFERHRDVAIALGLAIGGPLVAAMTVYLAREAEIIGGKLLEFWASLATGALRATGAINTMDAGLATIGQTETAVTVETTSMSAAIGSSILGFGALALGVAAAVKAYQEFTTDAAQVSVSVSHMAQLTDTELVAAFEKLASVAGRDAVDAFRKLADQAPGTAKRVIDSMQAAGKSTAEFKKILDEVAAGHRQAAKDAQTNTDAIDQQTAAVDKLTSSQKEWLKGISSFPDALGSYDEALKAAQSAAQDQFKDSTAAAAAASQHAAAMQTANAAAAKASQALADAQHAASLKGAAAAQFHAQVTMDNLAKASKAAQDHAAVVASTTKSASTNWQDLAGAVHISLNAASAEFEKSIQASENWARNAAIITARGGGDVVAEFAKMGQKGQELAALMADSTAADFDRMHRALVTRTLLTSEDTAKILDDMANGFPRLAAKAGKGYADTLSKALRDGTITLAQLVADYDKLMTDGANSVLISVGGKPVVLNTAALNPLAYLTGSPGPLLTGAAAGATIGPGFVTNGPEVVVGEGKPQFPEYVLATDPQYGPRNRALWIDAGKKLQMLAGGGTIADLPVPANIGTGVLQLAASAVETAAYNAVKTFLSATGGGPTGPVPPGSVRDWLTQAIQLTGVGMDWLSGLYMIAMGETGGDPHSKNTTDINAMQGNPSEGMMQTTISTFRGNMLPGHGDIWNPVDNAIAAIRYILGRYHTIGNVPGVRSEMAGGPYKPYAAGGILAQVFDQGGWLQPGLTLAANNTGRAEPVGSPGGGEVHLHFDMHSEFPNYVGDRRELMKVIDDEMMRRARTGELDWVRKMIQLVGTS